MHPQFCCPAVLRAQLPGSAKEAKAFLKCFFISLDGQAWKTGGNGMVGDSFSPAEQGENISWVSPSAATGRGGSSPQLTLVIWKEENYANIAEETLLLYKAKCAEMCQKCQNPQLPGFVFSVQGLLHKM